MMSFDLTNASATFQTIINAVLKEYLDDFAMTYIDDILIYSKTLEKHLNHIKRVLQKL